MAQKPTVAVSKAHEIKRGRNTILRKVIETSQKLDHEMQFAIYKGKSDAEKKQAANRAFTQAKRLVEHLDKLKDTY